VSGKNALLETIDGDIDVCVELLFLENSLNVKDGSEVFLVDVIMEGATVGVIVCSIVGKTEGDFEV